jgi:hypothetical protein
MRSRHHWLAAVALVGPMLCMVTPLTPPAAAQVLDPIQYSLFSQSDLTFGCTGPCACPVFTTGPISGTFTFYRTAVDPLFTHYELLNISWRYAAAGTGKLVHVTGHGTYDLGGEVAVVQRMQLDLVSDGTLGQHFDSGAVPVRAAFPAIDIVVHDPVNACLDSVLHIVTGPQGTESVDNDARALRLSAAPNPASWGTNVTLATPESEPGRIEVLGVDGRTVTVLAEGMIAAGVGHWHWDGRTAAGADAGAGVFWVRARVGTREAILRVVRFR